MNAARCVLAIAAGVAFGVLAAELILGLGPRDAGICIAVMAGCVILRYLIKAIQTDRDDATRIGREAVWLRRDREQLTDSLVDDFAGTWPDDTRKETR